jgi:hypothetical protein
MAGYYIKAPPDVESGFSQGRNQSGSRPSRRLARRSPVVKMAQPSRTTGVEDIASHDHHALEGAREAFRLNLERRNHGIHRIHGKIRPRSDHALTAFG